MKCACSLTPVFALVGLVGLGVGGFNLARTGCPLGLKDPAATVTAASSTSEPHCALCPSADIKPAVAIEKKSECPALSADAKCCSKGDKIAPEDCCGKCKTETGDAAVVTASHTEASECTGSKPAQCPASDSGTPACEKPQQ